MANFVRTNPKVERFIIHMNTGFLGMKGKQVECQEDAVKFATLRKAELAIYRARLRDWHVLYTEELPRPWTKP